VAGAVEPETYVESKTGQGEVQGAAIAGTRKLAFLIRDHRVCMGYY